MPPQTKRVRNWDLRVKTMLNFQVTTTSAGYNSSEEGVWFIRNNGTNNIYINFVDNTVTTLDFQLRPGEALDTDMFVRENENIYMIADTATQTVSGWIYNYA